MPDALESLLSNADWARRLAFRLVRDTDEAEDVVQQAWEAALRHPPHQEGPLRPWLATVIRNVIRDGARARTSARTREGQSETERLSEAPADPETLLANAQALRRVADLVMSLDEPLRQTVLLRYFEGRSAADIARGQGIPEGTARWRLKAGLDELRRRLDKETGGDREAWQRALAPLFSPPTLVATARKRRRALMAAAFTTAVLVFAIFGLPARTRTSGTTPLRLPTRPAETRALAAQTTKSTTVAPSENEVRHKVEGTVSDASGGTIAGATLSFQVDTGDPSSPTESATSDGQGHYAIALRPQRYKASAQSNGYIPAFDRWTLVAAARRDVALVPEAVLTGKVVDGNGTPVAAATVHIRHVHSPSQAAGKTVMTDEDGQFSIPEVATGVYRVIGHKGDYIGRLPRTITVQTAERVDDLVIELDPARRIEGVVTDDADKPVADARVFAETADRADLGTNHIDPAEVRCDSAGRFVLNGLNADVYAVSAEAPHRAPSVSRTVDVRSGSAAAITLKVGRSAVVEGRVLSVTGDPVANALVSVEVAASVSGNAQMRGQMRVRSAKNGGFVADGFGPGVATLSATHPNFGRVELIVPAVTAGERRKVELKFAAPAYINGRVLWEDGSPAAGIVVTDERRTAAFAQVEAGTDATGGFHLGPVSAGDVQLRARGNWPTSHSTVSVSGRRPANSGRETITVAPGQTKSNVVLKLARRDKTISGVVVGPDGRGVDGAQVSPHPDTDASDWVSEVSSPPCVTAPDGSFAISGLAAGTYVISVQHTQHPKLSQAGVVAGRSGLRLQLVAGAILAGIVVDENNRPVSNFAVEAKPQPHPDQWSFSSIPEGPRLFVTAGDGRFELKALDAKTYEVVVRTDDGRGGRKGWIPLRAGDRKSDVRIQIGPAVNLLARFVDHGTKEPIANVEVALAGESHHRTRSDETGRVRVEGLAPGQSAKLRVFPPDDHNGHLSYRSEYFQVVMPENGDLDLGTRHFLRTDSTPQSRKQRTQYTLPGLPLGDTLTPNVLRLPESFLQSLIAAGIAPPFREGDRLLSIDGTATEGLGLESLQWLLAGPPGSSAELVLQTPGETPRTVTMPRPARGAL